MSQFDDYMRAQKQATDYKLIKCAETYFWFLEVDASIYVRQEIEDFRQIESAKECFKNSPLVLRELVQTVLSDEGCEPKLVFEHLCELNWFEKAKDIIKKVRAAMETVAVKNSKNYQEFCKVRKRSFKVQFHSEEVHLRLKETGFCMNPKMLTPDGVHCFECKSSFFGFRPWNDPSKLHNHTIKHRSDAEYLKRTDVVYIGNKQDQESI